SLGLISRRATRFNPSSHAFGSQEWLIGFQCCGSWLQVTKISSLSGYAYCENHSCWAAFQYRLTCALLTSTCGCSSYASIISPSSIVCTAYNPYSLLPLSNNFHFFRPI